MLAQLTKKNAEYVVKFRRSMKDSGADDAKETAELKKMLPEMLKGQREGKPAVQLFGPAVERGNKVASSKTAVDPIQQQPFWISTADLGFTFLAIFAVLYGLIGSFSKVSGSQGGGFASLVIMSFVAALVFTYYTQWSLTPKGERPKFWFIAIGGIILIIFASLASSYLTVVKSFLTSPMNNWGLFILAVVAYGIHYLLKSRYHLRSFFAPLPRR
ncbi:DUF1129 domain-containing protein [Lacticaseibacillus thailandensis]|nr:DUF1129 family protein [Lacticaseibacillus thailandensis]